MMSDDSSKIVCSEGEWDNIMGYIDNLESELNEIKQMYSQLEEKYENLKRSISGRNYYPTMHAIQCRINAEDPYKNFMPSPGKITDYHCPGGHGVRIDAHAYAGYVIPPFYDSMISKLITVAQTREEAIAKMQRALDEYIIEGIKTTIPFHQKLMKDEKFRSGDFTTKFLEDWTM